MTDSPSIRLDPDAASLQRLVEAAPRNPFATPAYVEARRVAGARPAVALSTADDGTTAGGCALFLTAGRLRRHVEIPSLPPAAISGRPAFWRGLLDWCAARQVTDLEVTTFASDSVAIPDAGEVTARRARREHVLDLAMTDALGGLSSNHRRNVRRAERAGVTLSIRTDGAAVGDHERAGADSLARRAGRGEAVDGAGSVALARALLATGAARLFQAVHEGTVVSSILVLQAPRGAYYHSAGTTPEGMALGASHFLVHATAGILKADGLEVFNLGGAGDGEDGLARFKTGFGTRAVELQSATLRPRVRGLRGALDRLRRRPAPRASAPVATGEDARP